MTSTPSALATWLVVIDMQEVFGDPASPWAAPRFDEVIEPIRALCAAYAPRVVFTRYLAPADPQGAWQPYFAQWPFAAQPPDSDLWTIVPALADLPAQSWGIDGAGGTLDAETFSKWGPALGSLAGQEGRLVMTGVSADCCVIATALASADAGIETWVVREATAGADDTTTGQALAIMALFDPLLKVVSSEEALAQAPAPLGV